MSDHRDPEEKFGSRVNLKKASENTAKIEKTPERSKSLRKLGSFHSLNDFNSTNMEKGENSTTRKTSVRGRGKYVIIFIVTLTNHNVTILHI